MAVNKGDELRLVINGQIVEANIIEIEAIPRFENGIQTGSIMKIVARPKESSEEFVQKLIVMGTDWPKVSIENIESLFANAGLKSKDTINEEAVSK